VLIVTVTSPKPNIEIAIGHTAGPVNRTTRATAPRINSAPSAWTPPKPPFAAGAGRLLEVRSDPGRLRMAQAVMMKATTMLPIVKIAMMSSGMTASSLVVLQSQR
jgi:hypothetical protein